MLFTVTLQVEECLGQRKGFVHVLTCYPGVDHLEEAGLGRSFPQEVVDSGRVVVQRDDRDLPVDPLANTTEVALIRNFN